MTRGRAGWRHEGKGIGNGLEERMRHMPSPASTEIQLLLASQRPQRAGVRAGVQKLRALLRVHNQLCICASPRRKDGGMELGRASRGTTSTASRQATR